MRAASTSSIHSCGGAPDAASGVYTVAGGGWPAGGKPRQKIVVACARELAGSVWAIVTEQPLRAEG